MAKMKNMLTTTPIPVEKSLRLDEQRILTSGNAGKILPIAYIPLLREDSIQRASYRIDLEMMETAERLLNGVIVNAYAYYVPFTALPEFNKSMDQLNRSYMGQPQIPGGAVVPFLSTATSDVSSKEVYKTLGLHVKNGDTYNSRLMHCFWAMVNHRRAQRSNKISPHASGNLPEAFWHHSGMEHIVPDYESALVDGEVELQFVDSDLPVRGLGYNPSKVPTFDGSTDILDTVGSRSGVKRTNDDNVGNRVVIEVDPTTNVPLVFAEMQAAGAKITLANIEQAKKTAAFARMRQNYSGYTDDYLVDVLMGGLRLPEAALSEPIMLDHKSTLFGYSSRWATDAANLDESVTTGQTFVDMNFRLPAQMPGGVVFITVEITPDQMWERKKDYWLHATDVADFPQYERDYLDTDKVKVIENRHVDVLHTDPDAVFGYGPQNMEWQRSFARVGGKFYRPTTNTAFDEDRQRIWAVETIDPELTEDFYLCTTMHQKVFSDTLADGFEIVARGRAEIIGNTVFGPVLAESNDEYAKTKAKIEDEVIVQP